MAKSKSELQQMMNLLIPELRAAGLQLNAKKTKVLINDTSNFKPYTSSILWAADQAFHIIPPQDFHKYLGRQLSFGSHTRIDTEVQHRIQAAWL